MRKFSWHTSKVKYEGNGCYVTTKVHHALTDFAYNECVEHYRPNMKGGHRHNHISNHELRLMYSKKEIRQLRRQIRGIQRTRRLRNDEITEV